MRILYKFFVVLGFFLAVPSFYLFAQVGINSDNSAPDASAGLDVKFNNKGFLMPRMTTLQRNAIQSPAEGLLIFNLTTGCIDYYLGSSWKSFCGVSEPTFQCGMKMTDARDGKMYNTLKIGTQCWMAENLNIGTKINSLANQDNNSIIEKYCHSDLESNCGIYGGLYQWDEMMQYVTTQGVKGICPTGWHIPTEGEWCTVTQFLDPTVDCGSYGMIGTNAGGKMKSTGSMQAGTGLWFDPNTGATNESGFTAVPAGYRHNDGFFFGAGHYSILWSSSEYGTNYAFYRSLYNDYNYVGRNTNFKIYGFSVRCLRDF